MNRLLFILIACLLGFPALLAKAVEPVPITAQDYCRFLKCVAFSDPHCFYDEKLALDPACIIREGTPGNYAYSVLPGKENQSVSYLSWHDAACYANWSKQEEDHLSDDLTLSSNGFQIDNAAQSSDQELKSNIVHFSLINDQALDKKIPSSKEPPSWISYMMIPFFILGESGQAVPRVSPDHVSVPTPSRSSYRFSDGVWEKKQLEGTWELTNRFANPGLGKGASENVTEPPGLSDVLVPFIQHHNRADNISTKKEEYQKELNILALDSDRALMLNHLVPILEKAILYQDALIKPLIKSVGTLDVDGSKKKLDDPKKIASKTFLNFIDAMMINDRPNKIELIAKQIEEDYEHLTTYQNKLSEVQTQIETQPTQLNGLFQSRGHLNKTIQFQRTLIEQRASYAPLLHPPFEQLNTTTQANVDQHKWKLVETEALVSREYLLFQANTARDLGQPGKARYLNNAGNALFQAAEEAQKTPELRNPEAINLFQHSANLYQEAGNAWNPDQPLKATYLNNVGNVLFQVAQEAQQPLEFRNPEAINLFQRAAILLQEAASAWNPDQPLKANYLNSAGSALFNAAQEAQKTPELRNPEASNLFQRSAILLQEAARARNLGLFDKASSLNSAGTVLFKAAKEAQKPPELRNPEASNLLQRAAKLNQEAANAWEQDFPLKEKHLTDAATLLFHAAQEAQKPFNLRRQEVIDLFQRAASLHQKAATDTQSLSKEKYLYTAGHTLFQAAQEAQKPEPNPEVIARLVKEAEEFEEKANSSSSCIIS